MRARSVLLSLLTTLTAACGGGGGAAGPLAVSVAGVAWPAAPQGVVPLQVTLAGSAAGPVDLDVEVSFDGGARWVPAAGMSAAAGSGLAVPGTHTVPWDALVDVGSRPRPGTRLCVTPGRGPRVGTARVVELPPMDNVREAAGRVDLHMIHYGPPGPATRRRMETYDPVVIHPANGDVDVATARDIMDGVDPADPPDDVLVLGYVTIGEDGRTIGLTNAQMLVDPRFAGDGTGPRVDPRGPNADGRSVAGLDPLGLPAPGGTGFASWYLSDNAVGSDPAGVGDGLPDRNGVFGGAFVSAGDPKWFDVVDAMRFDGPDQRPGMRELLARDYGRGGGLDGLFLDTVETCAPNEYTDASFPNQTEYEGTAPGFRAFLARIRATHPRALLLQNRAMFFFNPRFPPYAATTRPLVDFLLIEGYRLNSHEFELFSRFDFPDNKYNFVPKLQAEAGRTDGFRILSPGYAEGPVGAIDLGTLTGDATPGYDTRLEDIDEAQRLAGLRHDLTDDALSVDNAFVRLPTDLSDTEPPVWTSTYNDNEAPFPIPPGSPTPRVGIQAAESGPGCLLVRWDVALDLHRVGYALYDDTQPLDFQGDPTLSRATRRVLVPSPGGGGCGPTAYANQDVLPGVPPGQTLHLCIRAFDSLGHEERNTVQVSAMARQPVTITVDGLFDDWLGVPPIHTDPADVPDSSGPDWREIRITNDADHLYRRYGSENAFNLDGSPGSAFSRTLIFLDLDGNPATGYAVTPGVGSELLVFGNERYAQAAGVFNDGFPATLAASPLVGATDVELAASLSEIDLRAPGATRVTLVFLNDDAGDQAPDDGAITYRLLR